MSRILLLLSVLVFSCQPSATQTPVPSASPEPTTSLEPTTTPEPQRPGGIPADFEPTLNTDFTLALKERLHVDEQLFIAFDSVTEDSRCPEGVNCIQAGQVTVNLRIDTGKGAVDTQAVTLKATEEQALLKWGNYDIILLAVNPYPVDGQPTENYSITLRVEP